MRNNNRVRFNPSSTGIAAQTVCERKRGRTFIKFQSFFYWNCGPNPPWADRARLRIPEFQSFFYWNCGPNRFLCRTLCTRCCVSILLLLELRPKPSLSSFSSPPRDRFNPSSTGIAAQTEAIVSVWGKFNMFQSFFYWNCGPNRSAYSTIIRSILVSILLLLELRPKPAHACRINRLNPAFQSFFYWNCGPNRSVFFVHQPSVEVSILLLLELRPKLGSLICFAWMRLGFNPSSTGIAAQTGRSFLSTSHRSRFQSFFYWNCGPNNFLVIFRCVHVVVSILLLLELRPKPV